MKSKIRLGMNVKNVPKAELQTPDSDSGMKRPSIPGFKSRLSRAAPLVNHALLRRIPIRILCGANAAADGNYVSKTHFLQKQKKFRKIRVFAFFTSAKLADNRGIRVLFQGCCSFHKFDKCLERSVSDVLRRRAQRRVVFTDSPPPAGPLGALSASLQCACCCASGAHCLQ